MKPLLDEQDVHLSYVPLAHIFERSIALLCLASGAALGFQHGTQTALLDDVRVLKPTFLVGLPGAFRQLHRQYSTVQQQWGLPYRKLFALAWRRKLAALRRGEQQSQPRREKWLDWLMFGSIAKSLGGRLRFLLVCDRDFDTQVREFLQVALDVSVLVAFGFPEAGGLVTIQSPSASGDVSSTLGDASSDEQPVTNCTGFPMPCHELKLVPLRQGKLRERRSRTAEDAETPRPALSEAPPAQLSERRASSAELSERAEMSEIEVESDDECDGDLLHRRFAPAGGTEQCGELLIRGANTFEGYHGKAHLTAQAYDAAGWLKTGYICFWGPQGLNVLGKRNAFLHAAGGKYVSAQRLEAIYAHRCPMIHQIWCHCEAEAPLLAVVALDREAVFRWLQAQRLDLRRAAEHSHLIQQAVLKQLHSVAVRCKLQPHEYIHDLHIVKSLGQADDDYTHLATPTFVLRRAHLKRRYEQQLRRLHGSRESSRDATPSNSMRLS